MAPGLPGYLQATTSLQELLGRLNDLAVARQMTLAALPGRKGEALQAWLGAAIESLRPELARQLSDFQQRVAPWKEP